jgi:hypothetical protein
VAAPARRIAAGQFEQLLFGVALDLDLVAQFLAVCRSVNTA